MELASIIPGFKLIVNDYDDPTKLLKNIKILKELEIYSHNYEISTSKHLF